MTQPSTLLKDGKLHSIVVNGEDMQKIPEDTCRRWLSEAIISELQVN